MIIISKNEKCDDADLAFSLTAEPILKPLNGTSPAGRRLQENFHFHIPMRSLHSRMK